MENFDFEYESFRFWGEPALSDGEPLVAEIFIREWRVRGAELLGALRGTWALAFVHDGKVHLARDHFGYQPLYYRGTMRGAEVAPFASALGDPAQDAVDEEFLACFLMDDFSLTDRSFLCDVKQVEPGTLTVLGPDGFTKVGFQEPALLDPFAGDLAAASVRWRELLLRSLERGLQGSKRVGILVSGGVDSAGLLAFTLELKRLGRYVGEVRLYHAAFGPGPADTEGVAPALAAFVGCPIFCTELERRPESLRWRRTGEPWDLPYFPTFQMYEPLLAKATEDGCDRVLFGYGAEEQLAAPLTYLADLLATFRLRKLLRELVKLRAEGETPRSLVRATLLPLLPSGARKFLRKLRTPQPVAPLVSTPELRTYLRRALDRWNVPAPRLPDRARATLWVRLRSWGGLRYSTEAHAQLCARAGVRCVLPYFDPELIRFSLSLPVGFLIENPLGKGVLRESLRGLLKDDVRLKPKFQDYGPFSERIVEPQRDEWPRASTLEARGWLAAQTERASSRAWPLNSLLKIQFAENILRAGAAHASFKTRGFMKNNKSNEESKHSMPKSETVVAGGPAGSAKRPYVSPDLKEFGLISDFTQAITATMQADGGVAPANFAMNCVSLPPVIQEHRWLLQDTHTQEKFRAAILKRVKPGDVVLDLGTGTGLHAFFAVEAGASKVYAVDAEPIIDLARALAKKNGLADKIEFIQSDAMALSLPEKVDVIVTNIGFLWTLRTLPALAVKFLKPGGRLIPESLQLGCTLVEDAGFHREHVGFWSSSLWNLDLQPAKGYATSRPFYGSWGEERILAETRELEPFDLTSPLPPTRFWGMELTATRDGEAHGILGWYTFHLGDGIKFTTRPPLVLSREIWSQWFFPLETPMRLSAGEKVDLQLSLGLPPASFESVWSWAVKGPRSSVRQNSFDAFFLSKKIKARDAVPFGPAAGAPDAGAKSLGETKTLTGE